MIYFLFAVFFMMVSYVFANLVVAGNPSTAVRWFMRVVALPSVFIAHVTKLGERLERWEGSAALWKHRIASVIRGLFRVR